MCKGLSRSFKDRSFHLHSPYVRDHYFLESLKEKSWIERPGKWSKGPKAAKPFPATWKRRACSGNSRDSRSDDCRYDDVLDAKAAYSR